MIPLTAKNIKARRVALWGCSIICLILFALLCANSGIFAPSRQTLKWQQFQEIYGGFLFEHRNPISIILLLMLLTGVMHALKKEFRTPAILLSLITLASILLAFNGGIHSDF